MSNDQHSNDSSTKSKTTSKQVNAKKPVYTSVQLFNPNKVNPNKVNSGKTSSNELKIDSQHQGSAHIETSQLNQTNQSQPKPIPIPKGMPNILENHKQTHKEDGKPFQFKFLLPKYWGIWISLAVLLPLIYLPLRIQFWIGRQLGILLYYLLSQKRKLTLKNIERAFPEKFAEEHERMAKQVFVNQGIGVFESLCAWYRPNVFTRAISISGLQYLIEAKNLIEAKKNDGSIILMTSYYTPFAVTGRLFTQFSPADIIYHQHSNELINWFVYNRQRQIYSHIINSKEFVETDDAKQMRQILMDTNPVLYLPSFEQSQTDKNVLAPFFGINKPTDILPRNLSNLDETKSTAVLMLHCYRQTPDNLKRGKRPHYHITLTPVFNNFPSNDVTYDATRINEALESHIRIDPTQWMWFRDIF